MTSQIKLFLDQFLKNWRQTGSIVPSSRHLAEALVSQIDFRKARHIVELGPGTGVMTREILARMHPECVLIAYELSDALYQELLKIPDRRLRLIHGSALDIRSSIDTFDVVISGLPLANFTVVAKIQLLLAVKDVLRPGGQFLQFQYTLESHSLIKRVFGNLKRGFVLWNAPPAFLYCCRKN